MAIKALAAASMSDLLYDAGTDYRVQIKLIVSPLYVNCHAVSLSELRS